MTPNAAPLPQNASFKTVWSLSWPMMVMMMLQFAVGFTDVFVAGRISKEAQASLGMIAQALFFFLILANAGAGACVSAVSQALGAGLVQRAARYARLSLGIALLFGAVFALTGQLLVDPVLRLMRTPAEIEPIARIFLEIFLMVLPPNYLLIMGNAIFRAYAKVHLPLAVMLLVAAVNALLDFALGFGLWGFPHWGAKGVALATLFSVTGGALLSVWILIRSGVLARPFLPPLRWTVRAFPYLFKVAWPSSVFQGLWQIAYMVLFSITATLPTGAVDALAGFTAGMRVESILFMPGFAFNMSASITVGHYLGMGKKDEAKRAGYKVLAAGVAFVSLIGACLWPFVDETAALLAPDPAAAKQAASYLVYNILAIPFTEAGMILAGVMTGSGAAVYTMIVFGIGVWVIRLPLAWLFGHVLWQDAAGVWLSMLISQVVQALVMLAVFHKANWARFAMRNRDENRRKRSPAPKVSP